MKVLHTLKSSELIEYKSLLKSLLDISCKYKKSGQIVRVYNYFDTVLKIVYPILHIPNFVKVEDDEDRGKVRLIVTSKSLPEVIDVFANTQYTPRSTAKVLSKYIITMAILIDDIQVFRKSLDDIEELELLEAKSNRELPKMNFPIQLKHSCSFSTDYPDSHAEQNRTDSILYGGYPTNYIEIDDTKEVLSTIKKDGSYKIPIMNVTLRFANYPIIFEKLHVRSYLKRYIDGFSINMVNSTAYTKDLTVHVTHVK